MFDDALSNLISNLEAKFLSVSMKMIFHPCLEFSTWCTVYGRGGQHILNFTASRGLPLKVSVRFKYLSLRAFCLFQNLVFLYQSAEK